MSDIDKYEAHCRIDNRIMAERLSTLRRQDDLNDRLYRLERLVNRHPHGTAHRRHGFLDSEHDPEAKFMKE